MIVQTLYKKNKDKVQEWSIEVEQDKYRSIEGYIDGIKTISTWRVAKPKNIGKANEINSIDQAMKEALAKVKLKKDNGYFESIKDIHDVAPFEPMLAHIYGENKEKVKYPCFVQPKLDGMRCNIHEGLALSRKRKPINAIPHILATLPSSPEITFDGELYNHDLKNDFNQLISLVKQPKPTIQDLANSASVIQYHVYDVFFADTPDMKFSDRHLRLKQYISTNGPIVIVPVRQVSNETELDAAYAQCLEEGYEGMMIRNNTDYVQKRTTNLLKRKEWIDEEFKITGVLEGEGNRSGMMGKFVLVDSRGEEFEADGSGLGGHDAYKEILENKQNYIGKIATVKYQNLTPDRQVPRFAKVVQIRDYE